jgi:hypothetical protein
MYAEFERIVSCFSRTVTCMLQQVHAMSMCEPKLDDLQLLLFTTLPSFLFPGLYTSPRRRYHSLSHVHTKHTSNGKVNLTPLLSFVLGQSGLWADQTHVWPFGPRHCTCLLHCLAVVAHLHLPAGNLMSVYSH